MIDTILDVLASDELQAQRENRRYVRDHYTELQDDYPGQYVVVLDQGVVETIPGMDDETVEQYRHRVETVFDELRDTYGDRVEEIYTEFILDPNQHYHLLQDAI